MYLKTEKGKVFEQVPQHDRPVAARERRDTHMALET
jgi:hypothetical protein